MNPLIHARHILHSRLAIRDAKRARLSNFGARPARRATMARHARELSPYRYQSISRKSRYMGRGNARDSSLVIIAPC